MSFDWADYLKVADDLKNIGSRGSITYSEAYYRAAISRAYYAAFKIAQQFLDNHPDFPKQYTSTSSRVINSHWYVINEFGNDREKGYFVSREYWPIYTGLKNLKRLREKADYHKDFIFDSRRGTFFNTTDDVIEEAKTVISNIETIEKDKYR